MLTYIICFHTVKGKDLLQFNLGEEMSGNKREVYCSHCGKPAHPNRKCDADDKRDFALKRFLRSREESGMREDRLD